jgi:hypothetical protein
VALGDGQLALYGEESLGAGTGLDPSFEELAAGEPSTYEVAGGYVTSVIRRWGVERFMDFHDSVPRRVSKASFEEMLAREGTSLAELAAWRRADIDAGLLAGIPLLRCSAREADVVDGRFRVAGTVGCGHSGHRRGLSSSFTSRRLVTVGETQPLTLVTMELEDEGAFSLRSCEHDEGLFVRREDRGPGMLVAISKLIPGMYTLSAEISVNRAPQPIDLGVSAFDGGVLALSDLPMKIHLNVRAGDVMNVPVDVPSDRYVVLRTPVIPKSAGVRLCAAETCVDLAEHDVYDVGAGRYELRTSSDEPAKIETDFWR